MPEHRQLDQPAVFFANVPPLVVSTTSMTTRLIRLLIPSAVISTPSSPEIEPRFDRSIVLPFVALKWDCNTCRWCSRDPVSET